jgi:bacteriocin biosynthesis cyclodehydratase domain-containing protein
MSTADEESRARFALRGLAGIATRELPERPRLVPWLAFVELGDGRLQLRATDFAFTIPDPMLADVVRHLRELLDGSRSVEELTGSGGAAFLPGTILFVLKLLRQRGVLQEAAQPALEAEDRDRFAPALRFFSHHTSAPEEVLGRLRQARVTLTGDPALGRQLADTLAEMGVGFVESTDAADAHLGAQTGLIVALARTPATRFFETVNATCLGTGRRWMHVALAGRAALVGPTVAPGETACFTCLGLRQATFDRPSDFEAFRAHTGLHGENDEGALGSLTTTMVSQAALEIVRLFTGFAPPATFGRLFVFDAAHPRVVGHDVLRVPRCPSCARKQSPRDPWDLRMRVAEHAR